MEKFNMGRELQEVFPKMEEYEFYLLYVYILERYRFRPYVTEETFADVNKFDTFCATELGVHKEEVRELAQSDDMAWAAREELIKRVPEIGKDELNVILGIMLAKYIAGGSLYSTPTFQKFCEKVIA